MKYCFQLLPHANSHYRQSQSILGAHELVSMLSALSIETSVAAEELGGSLFFVFEAPQLTDEQLTMLSGHSSLLMLAREENGLLRPLNISRQDYMPRDLAEMLKYKGKTSASFTRMLINMALSAAHTLPSSRVKVLDPMCGRGTTCFCTLGMGMNAVGLDVDRNDLRELMTFFSRYLTQGKYKHALSQSSETRGKKAISCAQYTLADTKEHFQSGDTRTLTIYETDAGMAGPLMKKHTADILVTDLPYGIQHAPQDGRKPESFTGLLERILPSWREGIKKGGAMALSFNTLTLKRQTLMGVAERAGFSVLEGAPWDGNEHFVEQAVTRDILIAVNP